MKKTIFIAVIISALSISSSFAQDAPVKEKKEHREKKGGKHGSIYKDLNLSEAQKAKIKAINEDQKTKLQAMKDDKSLSDDARKKKVMELRKARKEKINAMLTPEQKTKLEAKMKERRKARANKKKK